MCPRGLDLCVKALLLFLFPESGGYQESLFMTIKRGRLLRTETFMSQSKKAKKLKNCFSSFGTVGRTAMLSSVEREV